MPPLAIREIIIWVVIMWIVAVIYGIKEELKDVKDNQLQNRRRGE